MIDGLYYEQSGPENAETVILSAGLGGSASYWAPNIASLAQRYRVITYDQRGTGRSDRSLPPGLTIADMADDVLALMEGLGIAQAHFVGHALGGLIGLSLAASMPDRLSSLAVINGWSALDDYTARCFEVRLALLRNSGLRAYLRAQPIFLYPAEWISRHSTMLDEELEQQLASVSQDNLEARLTALQAFDCKADVAKLSVPLLALAAEDDMLVPWTCSRHLADRASMAGLEVMDRGGHACNVTRPDDFDRILSDWIASRQLERA